MRFHKSAAIICLVLAVDHEQAAASSIPLGPKAAPTETLVAGDITQPVGTSPLLNVACSPVPTLAEVKGSVVTYEETFLSTKQAAELGIAWAKITGSQSHMILVRDAIWKKDCPAVGGQATVSYGYGVRTVISIADATADGSLTLAALAAKATLERKNYRVLIQVIGIENAAIANLLATIAAQSLDVDSYATYKGLESQLIKVVADPATILTVNLLQIQSPVDALALREGVIRSFALFHISKGKSCTEALSKLGSSASGPDDANVRATYQQVAGGCSSTAPDSSAKEVAAKAMVGRQVK
jgi:hypothetical protein